jgi:hypothetical protein
VLSDSITPYNEKEEAIPLITFDTISKRFFINENAEAFLKKLEGPLGVISVAGLYRTGKSYLLNRMLLNRGNGFSVGPSINPCTKGLWIWPKALNGFSPDGSPLNVLIIDTEGIGATDEDQNHDNKIFTLGLLLSSYFIFNSVGSIDENAIHNLSFIVNITKNIQLHNTKNEEDDLRELAKFLPSFMWVIRDFSLRLIDPLGEPITSKEYLEKSLELQKGYSETVESKNKIRTLIKEFFRERDCVTLVRPLTEEDNLQNLSKMEMSKLRPEFLEQVNVLRKKVLHKVKPKTLNNKTLNGEMFCNVMRSYVNAINSGAVPVIENAYNLMCKNECQRALNNSLKNYIELMDLNVKKHTPMDATELNNHHKESRKIALTIFQESAFGMYSEEYLVELKNKIKEKQLQYKIENEKETKTKCESFINFNYDEIRQNLMKQFYKTYKEYKLDVEKFVSFYSENAPNGPFRSLFLYEFIYREILNTAGIFANNLVEDMNCLTSKHEDDLKKLNSQINELKSQLTLESEKNYKLIKEFEDERKKLIEESSSKKTLLDSIIKKEETTTRELNEKIENLKNEYEKKIMEMKVKTEMSEKEAYEKEKILFEKSADFDKNKSLLEQNIKNLEKTIEEMKEREKENFKDLSLMRSELLTNNKESTKKYENEISSLNEKCEQLQDRIIELETSLHEKEKRMENEKNKSDKVITDLKSKLEDMTEKLSRSEKEVLKLETKYQVDIEEIQKDFDTKLTQYKENMEKANKSIEQNQQSLSSQEKKYIMQISLLEQELELTKRNLSELKNKLDEDKKSYEAMINVLQEKNSALIKCEHEHMAEIERLKFSSMQELSRQRSFSDDKVAELTHKLESISTLATEWENKYLNKVNELQKEKEIYEGKLNETQKYSLELKNKLENSENEKMQMESEHRKEVQKLNSAFNEKFEKILKDTREEIDGINITHESRINELKRHYEIEKENINLLLSEEKEKFDEQLINVQNEYLERIEKIEKNRDEVIEEQEENYHQLDQNFTEYRIQAEQDIAIKNQIIESLNKFLADSKESLTSIQEKQESILQSQLERFKEEKAEFNLQLTKNMQEIRDKEREIGGLLIKQEQVESNLSKAKEEITNLINQANIEKSSYEEKISTLIQKSHSLNEDLHKIKSESSTEIALKKQEIEFCNNKISELQKLIEECNSKLEENIKQIREKLETEYSDKLESMRKEKIDLEKKLLDKIKGMKMLLVTLTGDKEMLEKERTFFSEKLVNLNQVKSELEINLEKERKESERKIDEIKSEYRRENSLIIKEKETMQIKMKELDNNYTKLCAEYEKDRQLWETKLNHLEEQKAKVEFDLNSAQLMFQEKLESFTKEGTMEKDKLKSLKKAIAESLQSDFQSHIKELQDNHNNKINELNKTLRSLETENKALGEKLKEKINKANTTELERKVLIMTENENKMKNDFNEFIKERDSKIRELNFFIEKERIDSSEKIFGLESELRKLQNNRSVQNANTSKEIALINKEKEMMQREIEKLNKRIVSLERLNTNVHNENARLAKENENLAKKSRSNSNSSSKIKFTSANKENRNFSNSSFEGIDFLSLGRAKYATTRNSEKSDDGHSVTSNTMNTLN